MMAYLLVWLIAIWMVTGVAQRRLRIMPALRVDQEYSSRR